MKKSSVIIVVIIIGIMLTCYFKFSNPSGLFKETSVIDSTVVQQETTEIVETTDAADYTEDMVASEEAAAQEPQEVYGIDAENAEMAYITDINDEVIQGYIEILDKYDVGNLDYRSFIDEHPEIFGKYVRDKDGNVMPDFSFDQFMSRDHDRQYAAANIGLEKNVPINDALDFPNAKLTESDVKAILAAGLNQKIKLELPDEEYKIWIYRQFLEKPLVFEAYVNLMLDQKIGSETVLRDNWTGMRQFTEAYDQARLDGIGVNKWLRCFEDPDGKQHFYTSVEYVQNVVSFISYLDAQPFTCEVLESHEHFHLLCGDKNILRKAEKATYSETKASFVWSCMLKDNKIGFRLGSNCRDNRPEVLNLTTVKKTTTKSNTTSKKTETKPAPQPAPQPAPTTPSTPSTPDTPSNPDPTPTPDPPKPTPTPEVKKPSEDPANNGNADVGGGKNDDKGPGEKKEDQGNSKSSSVQDSQYKTGNSENKTDAKTEHPSGPKADNTDNGKAPETKPIVTEESKKNDDYVEKSTSKGEDSNKPANPGTSKENTTEIAAPPVD